MARVTVFCFVTIQPGQGVNNAPCPSLNHNLFIFSDFCNTEPNGCATTANMFIEVQKLKLFSEHKSPELGSVLDFAGLHPLSYSRFTGRNGFGVIFLVKPSIGRRLAQLKSSNFDGFGNISRLVAQRLGELSKASQIQD